MRRLKERMNTALFEKYDEQNEALTALPLSKLVIISFTVRYLNRTP